MNEFVDRSMGFNWVKKSERLCDYSTIDHTENKKEQEFSAPRIEIENGEMVIKQKETK